MGEMAGGIETLIQGSGGWAYILAYGYTMGVAIVPFPAEFPAMLNGMIFGPALGTMITWSAALLGAQISFELSRRFGRPLVARFLRPGALGRADRVVVASGAPGLLLLRLTPVVAFTAINWAAGLTPLSRWTFFWTTAVGIIPGSILFTVSGSGLAALYRKHPVIAITLTLALVSFALLVHRRIRREAAAEIHTSDTSPNP
ncbi:MAG: VTT domain-containing protein [Gemmatimonadota bacterium]